MRDSGFFLPYNNNNRNNMIYKRKNSDGSGIHVSLVCPPAIRRVVRFPVIAVIANFSNNIDIHVRGISWVVGGRSIDYRGDIHLPPAGRQAEILENACAEEGIRYPGESAMVEWAGRGLGKAFHMEILEIDENTAAEIIKHGSTDVSVTVKGIRRWDGRSVDIMEKAVIRSSAGIPVPPPIPGAPGGKPFFGDTHAHSTYTWDYYIGNGIFTIDQLKMLAMAAGLDWLVLTDHSYCLDDKKYEEQKNAVTSACSRDFAFLYGEELSCAEIIQGRKSGNTCHCNSIMSPAFIPSSTNFLRKALSPDSQMGIDAIRQNGGLAVINHPGRGKGAFEAWNFSEGAYEYTHGETAVEIFNGGMSGRNRGSIEQWIRQRLLKGEKVFPVAGSDTESKNHLGECYTAAYADSLTQQAVKSALGSGRVYASTGPGIALWVEAGGRARYWMGDTAESSTGDIRICLSHVGNGNELELEVLFGRKGAGEEKSIHKSVVNAAGAVTYVNAHVEEGYIRAWCRDTGAGQQAAFTSPVWFE